MKQLLRRVFEEFDCQASDPEDLTPAAVLVPFYSRNDEPYVLFTKRTETVKDHKGQISFPGGVRDPSDADLKSTALRETQEELGIEPQKVEIFGRMSDQPTITGYLITPFVGWVEAPLEIEPSPDEIAEVIELPWSALTAPGVHDLKHYDHPAGWSGYYHTYTIGDVFIWGATAMLVNKLEKILEEGKS